MKTYFCPHLHSHFSLLDGLSQPKDILKRCIEADIYGCAMTDHGNINGSLAFIKAMNGKKHWAVGCELYVCDDITKKEDRDFTHTVVIAKNKQGWHDLCKLTSRSNMPDAFYYKPRVDINMLREYCSTGNIIGFSGHVGSTLASTIFTNVKAAYGSSLKESVRKLIRTDAIDVTSKLAMELQDIFGRGNFYIEIQLIDETNVAGVVVAEILREVSKKTGIKCLATADSHYPSRDDAINQRVLLCSNMKTTISEVQNRIISGYDVGLASFFRTDSYHIPTYSEMVAAGNTEEELENTMVVAESCEQYSLQQQPKPAKYECPDGLTSEQYLYQLCREGYKKRYDDIKRVCSNKNISVNVYGDRVKMELEVLQKAGLADYFLIVRDIINYAKSDGQIRGPGRGSASSCLVLYLLGVTDVDPIQYDLIYERFYNSGRNAPGNISMPDVDMDFETGGRQKIIEYIKNRFGHNNVAQMATYQRMQGRSALKDVLRVYQACSFDEMNRITEYIPDEAEISDQLQVMREADKEAGGDGEASILEWALDNNKKDLVQWCYKDENGELQGPYAKRFEQAINIEGTKRAQSKHAGGIIVSDKPLNEICPMIKDKDSDDLICGMEMGDLETIGLIKYDCLGVDALDKLHVVQTLVNEECDDNEF